MRKIATVVAALMLPVQAHALGVGEIEWNSALNQPLDAEIGLFSLGSVNENDIRVKLAPYEAYEQAGIEYPSILRDLKFSVESRPNGDYFIQVHSNEVVKEPFLDILVQVDWPSGHLMREFTLLLDLPVMTEEAAGPVSAPVTTTPPAPAAMTPTPVSEAAQPASNEQVFGETAPQQVSNDLRVGMVKRGDTLWGIAESMRRDPSVSVQQVMLALLKSNPEAFYNNNINNLKAGYVLRLDDPTLITEVSKAEAAREAQRQYQAWLAGKGGAKASAGGRKPAAVGTGAEQGAGGPSLRLVAPDEADVGLTASAGGNSQARNFSDMDLAALRQELESALQSSDAGREENEQLRARIAELEGQISKMQRLLSLRDDALTVLQANPQAQQEQPQSGDVATTTAQDTAGTAATMAGESSEGAADSDSPATDAVTTETQSQDEAGTGEVAPAATVVQQQPKAAGQKSAPKQKPATPREQGFVDTALGYIKRTLSAAGSLLNPMVLGGIVSGVLLLIGGAWFLRKRKISAEDLEQSMMVEVADKQLSEDLANGTVSDLEQKEETRAVELLDSASNDNFEADIDEIDVLAEADVYLAYQRFDRAEELMREAVNNEPQRLDLRFKLLEVYAASGNRDGFIETAEAIKAHGGQEDTTLWGKVVAMGAKIAPEYALFGVAEAAETVSDDTAETAGGNDFEAEIPGGDLEADFAGLDDDLMLDLDAHIAAESAEAQDSDTGAAAGEPSAEGLVDVETSVDSEAETVAFGEDAGDEAETTAAVTAAQAGEDEAQKDNEAQSLDFDLGDFSVAGDAGEQQESAASEAFVADNTLEYEAIGGVAESSVDDGAETKDSEASVTPDNSLDLDLELAGQDNSAGEARDLDFESESVAAVDEMDTTAAADAGDGLAFDAPEAEAAPTDVEEEPFDLDSLEGDSAGAIDDELTDDIDWLTGVADEAAEDDSDSFFSSEDEVATKLDLIRAYIDMGDKESARNILTEVVEEGNDDQKQEAEELLRQIG